MIQKIWHALIEGRLFATTAKALVKAIKRTPKVFKKLRNYIDKLISIPFIRLMSARTPVDPNKIIFITFRGEYDCNAKWIAEEIKDRGLPYTVVWTIRPKVPIDDIPETFIKTYRESFDFYKHLSSAKIIVDNGISTANVRYKKKKNQVLIQTWHGSIGIKKFSKETNKDKKWVAFATAEGTMTDYCLSNSTFEDAVYTDTFWTNSTILTIGHARNDVLCQGNCERNLAIKDKVYTKLGLYTRIEEAKKKKVQEIKSILETRKTMPWLHCHTGSIWEEIDLSDNALVAEQLKQDLAACEDLRICLYAPTFRDDGDMRPYKLDYDKLKAALTARFGGTWIILTRFHWRLRKKKPKFPAGVINAGDYSDIQELLICTDVGITDYSSWICDYLLTKRPGFLYATDMTEFEQKNREFFYPLTSMPYPLATDNDQLIDQILNFKDDHFEEACNAFLADKGCIDDGHASERIVDAIEKIMRGEKL